MEIQIPETIQIAKDFLKVLEREGIKSTEDLVRKVGQIYNIEKSNPDFIEITNRPSNMNTTTQTISYTRPGTGIPLEVKVNIPLAYSQIMLKTKGNIPGYSPFHIDNSGNIRQSKVISSADLRISISELESLARLTL